jgi:hypothetical protein
MRRREQRLAVALPVELPNGEGVTRDVSASGVFFETAVSFSPGSTIRLCLLLEHADPIGPIRLHCQGKVVRLERLHGRIGVAVAIDQHHFDPMEPRSVRIECGLQNGNNGGRR